MLSARATLQNRYGAEILLQSACRHEWYGIFRTSKSLSAGGFATYNSLWEWSALPTSGERSLYVAQVPKPQISSADSFKIAGIFNAIAAI